MFFVAGAEAQIIVLNEKLVATASLLTWCEVKDRCNTSRLSLFSIETFALLSRLRLLLGVLRVRQDTASFVSVVVYLLFM